MFPENLEELDGLYEQIAAQELIRKLEDCGVAWTFVAPYQYDATFTVSPDVWHLHLAKRVVDDVIILEVFLNGSPYFDINSDVLTDLNTLYDEILNTEELTKDQELFQTVAFQAGCTGT